VLVTFVVPKRETGKTQYQNRIQPFLDLAHIEGTNLTTAYASPPAYDIVLDLAIEYTYF